MKKASDLVHEGVAAGNSFGKILVVGLLVILSVASLGTSADASYDNYYFFDLVLDPKEHMVTGEMELLFRNETGVPLDALYFHVYPNAYQTHGGTCEVGWAGDGEGNPLGFHLAGEDNTILQVELADSLNPEEKCTVGLGFVITVPAYGYPGADPETMLTAPVRFCYTQDAHYLGNALPILCVHDETGWNTDPYCFFAESFHSDFARYEVSITVPKDCTVAATGSPVEERMEGELKIIRYETHLVREFMLVVMEEFTVLTEEYEGIELNIYYPPGEEKAAQATLVGTKRAMAQFQKHFGPYAYGQFSVVDHPMCAMEYPGLILFPVVETHKVTPDPDKVQTGLVHEIAHQWWYVTVGNDQNDEPWLDEAFATYSQVLFEEWEYGEKVEDIGRLYLDYLTLTGLFKIFGEFGLEPVDTPLASDVWSFPSLIGTIPGSTNKVSLGPQGYGPIVYHKGAAVLHTLRFVMGDEPFFEMLADYYERYKFSLVRGEDFIAIVQEKHGADLDWFFDQWLHETGYPTYEFAKAEVSPTADGKYNLVLEIHQDPGHFAMPVTLKIDFEGRSQTERLWIDRQVNSFEMVLDECPLSITLNPERAILGNTTHTIHPVCRSASPEFGNGVLGSDLIIK